MCIALDCLGSFLRVLDRWWSHLTFSSNCLFDIAEYKHQCVIESKDAVAKQDSEPTTKVRDETQTVIVVDMLSHRNLVLIVKELQDHRIGHIPIVVIIKLGREGISRACRATLCHILN